MKIALVEISAKHKCGSIRLLHSTRRIIDEAADTISLVLAQQSLSSQCEEKQQMGTPTVWDTDLAAEMYNQSLNDVSLIRLAKAVQTARWDLERQIMSFLCDYQGWSSEDANQLFRDFHEQED